MDYLVFNELSLPFKNEHEAKAGIRNFILAFAVAARAGFNQLRLPEKIGDNLYNRERRFRLPGGGKAYFEKHIKTGDLRFHFFPNEENHRIYVGYIGPHLKTITG